MKSTLSQLSLIIGKSINSSFSFSKSYSLKDFFIACDILIRNINNLKEEKAVQLDCQPEFNAIKNNLKYIQKDVEQILIALGDDEKFKKLFSFFNFLHSELVKEDISFYKEIKIYSKDHIALIELALEAERLLAVSQDESNQLLDQDENHLLRLESEFESAKWSKSVKDLMRHFLDETPDDQKFYFFEFAKEFIRPKYFYGTLHEMAEEDMIEIIQKIGYSPLNGNYTKDLAHIAKSLTGLYADKVDRCLLLNYIIDLPKKCYTSDFIELFNNLRIPKKTHKDVLDALSKLPTDRYTKNFEEVLNIFITEEMKRYPEIMTETIETIGKTPRPIHQVINQMSSDLQGLISKDPTYFKKIDISEILEKIRFGNVLILNSLMRQH